MNAQHDTNSSDSRAFQPRTIAVDIDDTLNNYSEILSNHEFQYSDSYHLSEEDFRRYIALIKSAAPDKEETLCTQYSHFKIKMQIETWDRAPMREQETIVGRTKREGAPLSGGEEFDQPDFALTGREGNPLVDPASHVALGHPDHNGGVHMLRRGYNYVDGNDQLGRLSAGLFFIAFVTDPRTHYIPMQSRMSRNDLMQEYLQHIGSGLWAVPPGVREGEFVGQALFA